MNRFLFWPVNFYLALTDILWPKYRIEMFYNALNAVVKIQNIAAFAVSSLIYVNKVLIYKFSYYKLLFIQEQLYRRSIAQCSPNLTTLSRKDSLAKDSPCEVVSAFSAQGPRPRMEDTYVMSHDGCFFAIFDGHGGPGVSTYTKDNVLSYLEV